MQQVGLEGNASELADEWKRARQVTQRSYSFELTEQRLPAGAYACTVHVGPYERLGDTWQRLMGEWIPSHGQRVDGLSYERYLNMPGSVPKEQLRTEICVPVAEE